MTLIEKSIEKNAKSIDFKNEGKNLKKFVENNLFERKKKRGRK
jgi:hypothetical protein